MEADKTLFQFTAELTENKFNKFFNPNLCHVCKVPRDNLISCHGCYMVFYCSKEHKNLDLNSHQTFCAIIAEYIRNNPLEYSYSHSYRSTSGRWQEFKLQCREYLKVRLGRDLEPYEIEMCMNAKSCLICNRQFNLQTCTLCYSANYCADDELAFKQQHARKCKEMLILLNINIQIINDPTYELYSDNLDFSTFTNMTTGNSMNVFAKKYLLKYVEDRLPRPVWTEELVLTDFASNPMSLFYAFQQSTLQKNIKASPIFVVHIIAASAIDINGLPLWEFLLHIYRNMQQLYIVMVRPKVDFISREIILCSKCIGKDKKLYVENMSMAYHEYVNMEFYKQPNVIIGFEAQLHVDKAWPESLRAILVQDCPLLFTTNTEVNVERIIDEISGVVPRNKIHYFCQTNKFSSCRPHRNYKTGGIFYRNTFVILFTEFK